MKFSKLPALFLVLVLATLGTLLLAADSQAQTGLTGPDVVATGGGPSVGGVGGGHSGGGYWGGLAKSARVPGRACDATGHCNVVVTGGACACGTVLWSYQGGPFQSYIACFHMRR